MGNGVKTKNYKIVKRDQKRVVSKPEAKSAPVVFVCNEVLKEIWVNGDYELMVGNVTFLTENGKEIRRLLHYCIYPPGLYKIKFDENDFHKATTVEAENVDQVLVDRILKLAGEGADILVVVIEGDLPVDMLLECLYASAKGKEIPLRVTYTVVSTGEEGQNLAETPLSDDYIDALKSEFLALVYLMLLEHFSGVSIDESVAAGGITKQEYKQIIQLKSKDPDLTPANIARVLTRAHNEYLNAGYQEDEFLLYMMEAMLYQRKRQNPLAMKNQLEIANGLLRQETGVFIDDFGVKQRGQSRILLYDKLGNAIPSYLGFVDKHYRNIDLDKIPAVSITVSDPGTAFFLQTMEQVFSFPVRETYVFLAGVSKFYHELAYEIERIYGGEIQEKIMGMLPTAIGFFIVHSVVGAMAKRGNPYAIAIVVMAKAAGWIMNIDMGITIMSKITTAGRHFAMMEYINRRSADEKEKQELTNLSKFHLEVRTRALIDAIAEIAAMGVFIIAGKLGEKSMGKIAKHIKASRKDARIEIKIKDGKVSEVRSTKGETNVDIETQSKPGTLGNPPQKGPKGEPIESFDMPPLDDAGVNMGKGQKSTTPKAGEMVPILEYKFKTADPKGRPASAEDVSGIPNEHLEYAKQIANEQDVVALFRTTNPRGVQHIQNGHPPKGKDLIALNTDKTSGKVTAKTKDQAKVAHGRGYYLLANDGYAYAKGWKTRLKGPDGNDLKFDMNAKGQFGELTNRAGQVIEPKTRKAVVGDYDLQDVIPVNAQTRNLAAVPEATTGDVMGPSADKFSSEFNARLQGEGGAGRVVHGADAQFMQYATYRKQAFKGDVIGVLPNGDVVFIPEAEVAAFYKTIGRARLQLPTGKQPQPYKKGAKKE